MADRVKVSQLIAQAETSLNQMRVSQLIGQAETSLNQMRVSQFIGQVEYLESTGPTMEQLMRHGTWFGSGVKQKMWWAK